MSTRCTINFRYGRSTEAKVYRHSDGYPDGEAGVIADLQKFFTDVETQTRDTRFDDPNYLAAKYIVWQANKNRSSYFRVAKHFGDAQEPKMLDFLSVGVCQKDPGDIEYTYFVDCSKRDENRRPVVTFKEVQ